MTRVTDRRLVVTAWLVATVVMYGGASLLGVAMRPSGSAVAVFWPAAGVAFALIVLALRPGRQHDRLAPAAVVVGVVGSNAIIWMIDGSSPAHATSLAAANGLEALLVLTGVLVLHRRSRVVTALGELACRAVVMAAAAAASGLVAATFSWIQLGAPWGETLRTWSVAHLVGMLVVAPALTPSVLERRGESPSRSLVERVGASVSLAAACAFVFGRESTQPVTWIAVPALLWAALRLGRAWTAASVAVSSLAIGILTHVGRGPFAGSEVQSSWLGLEQLYLGVLAVTAGVVAALVSDRNADEVALRAQGETYQRTFDDALLGMALVRLDEPAGAGSCR